MVSMIMALFLDVIIGRIMLNKLKKLYSVYKAERLKELRKDLPDSQIGLSPAERERVLKYPVFKEGEAIFFGKPFIFSHGPSMVHSVDELFGEELYKFISDTETPYIVDCGSNIGLSLFYFKKLYPKSRIIAFEPDENIFAILKRNLPNLPNSENIQIKNEAVWTEDTTLNFFSEGALAGSSVTDFRQTNNVIQVKATDLKAYLQEPVDFLKIDIEGAENEVIFDIKPLLHKVKNLFLEYHGIIGEKQNLAEILKLLSDVGFSYYIRLAGETIAFPFCNEKPQNFNQQLNIFCYKSH